jgi:hypothetical protein
MLFKMLSFLIITLHTNLVFCELCTLIKFNYMLFDESLYKVIITVQYVLVEDNIDLVYRMFLRYASLHNAYVFCTLDR